LFYEAPDYYYINEEGILVHFMLEVNESEGMVSGASHSVTFQPYQAGEGWEFYSVEAID
jgi:hypothetical protein